ncbi:Flavoprotein-like domain protein [Raphanus sativus]|nr:Flavoprotein-like domain protein [Raphanus sativus]
MLIRLVCGSCGKEQIACWVLREYGDSRRWPGDHCVDSNHTARAPRDAVRPRRLHIRNLGAGVFKMDSIRGGSPYGAGVFAGDWSREATETELALAELRKLQ